KNGIVTLSVSLNDSKVRISVADKGSGIPEEFQTKIFQPFSQADSSSTRGKSGTGLGLNISKAIAEKLHGTLNFSSSSKGTVFYLDLTIYMGDKILEHKEPIKNPQKFLICEDDEDQANYLALLLQGAGYECDKAYTVAHAKDLLKENQYK